MPTEKTDIVQSKNHMNKKHWITVIIDGPVPDKEMFKWIDHSYDLVAKR
jgi:predicted DNA-binding protein (MmcQ/YjbR family)